MIEGSWLFFFLPSPMCASCDSVFTQADGVRNKFVT
jgi:hypothetical protein